MAERDRPWLIRTYSGHSSARASNELYRTNLAKGQTGLSVAFDLPTQTGYDPDHAARPGRGRQGRRAGPAPRRDAHAVRRHPARRDEHVDDDQRDRDVAARHVPRARRRAGRRRTTQLAGTTQNDIVKEYLSRGTYIFPPEASKRLTVDLIAYTVKHVPKWNPINVCPYHLQEAGATPVQELAYGLANAIARARRGARVGPGPDRRVPRGRRPHLVLHRRGHPLRRRDVQDARVHADVGPHLPRSATASTDAKLRRFRYGMQVNSLGLTEEQPENNVQRIVLEMLGVTLSKDARARAIQLPCWNEALGLPTPWDQQWSLRIQQVLAYEIRPARVRRPVRGLEGRRGARSPSCAPRRRGRAAVGARRRRLVRDDRRDEGPARAVATPSGCAASSRAS